MGLFGKILGKEKIKFPSSRDVEKVEEAGRRAELRRAEKEAYEQAFARARISRASREGAVAGSRRWYDAFQNISVSTPTPGRTYTTRRKKRGKKKKKSKRRRGGGSGGYFDVGGGFDISDNWGFLK